MKHDLMLNSIQRRLLPEVTFARDTDLAQKRQIRVLAASGKTDRTGDEVVLKGIDLKNYKRNPLVLWAHDSRALPVGKAVHVSLQQEGLVMVLQFATAEEYDFADRVFRLIQGGYINGFSIGARVKEAEWIKDDQERIIGRRYTKMELLELSVVPIPADSKALIMGVQGGDVSCADVQECIAKTFDAPLDFSTESTVSNSTDADDQDGNDSILENMEDGEDMSKLEAQLATLVERVASIEKNLTDARSAQEGTKISLDSLNGLVNTLTMAMATQKPPTVESLKDAVSGVVQDDTISKQLSALMDTMQKKLSASR